MANDDVMEAVEETEPKKTSKKASTEASKSASKKSAPAKDSKSSDEGEQKGLWDKIVDFVYKYPFIAMVGFYLILSVFVRFWGWATIIFLAIPMVAAIRIYMLSKDVGTPIDGEDHKKLFWWARVGVYASIAGLISIVVLDWIGILRVFG